jgi:Carboxypeptidase regulatory-like domain
MRITRFVILFMLIAFTAKTQNISGKVIDLDTKKPLANSTIYLLNNYQETKEAWYGYDSVTQTKTNKDGFYIFKLVKPGKYAVLAEYEMPEKESFGIGVRAEIYKGIIVQTKNMKIKPFSLQVTCRFDKTKDQLFCPKCKKTDMVLPIRYGLPVPIYDSLGNVLDDWTKVHLGGCIMDVYCNPTKYCNRCSLEF